MHAKNKRLICLIYFVKKMMLLRVLKYIRNMGDSARWNPIHPSSLLCFGKTAVTTPKKDDSRGLL